MELATGRIEGTLLLFGRTVGDQRTTLVIQGGEHDLRYRPLPQPWALVQVGDDLAAEQPKIVAMLAQGLGGQVRAQQMPQERLEAFYQLLAGRKITRFDHPARGPLFQVRAVRRQRLPRRASNR